MWRPKRRVNWLAIGGGCLFIVVVLVVLLWPARYPDIDSWHTCTNSTECVVSVNIMCAGPYDNMHDACINVEHVERASSIPTGYTCSYGVAECFCSDGTCFAKR